MRRSRYRERFVVEWEVAVHQKDLRRHLLDIQPQILHFCGHGVEQGLLLEDDSGTAKVISNAAVVSLLKEFADEMGLTVHLCHFPPGTSKWNKIEHRLFCHITQNWRARPLTSLQVIINLIGSTTTEQGLEVRAHLDQNQYKTGIKVTDEQFNSIAIRRQRFHGDWNYSFTQKHSDGV